jgi:hypothetical protein
MAEKDLTALKRLPIKQEYQGLIVYEDGKRKVNGVEKYSKTPTKHVNGPTAPVRKGK